MLSALPRSGLLFSLLLALTVVSPARHTYAFPPAGSDVIEVTAHIGLTSRLGQESIFFIGFATIERGEPYVDGGVGVVDLEMTELTLGGESITGPITITQSQVFPSLGEIRSVQSGSDWPASAYLDVFVDVTAPASPDPEITIHNETALHILPMLSGSETPISTWPSTVFPWEADLTTCISLLPSLPKDVCITDLSISMSAVSPEVGGFAELPGIIAPDGGSPPAVLWLIGSAGLAALSVVWLARRRWAATAADASAYSWPQ